MQYWEICQNGDVCQVLLDGILKRIFSARDPYVLLNADTSLGAPGAQPHYTWRSLAVTPRHFDVLTYIEQANQAMGVSMGKKSLYQVVSTLQFGHEVQNMRDIWSFPTFADHGEKTEKVPNNTTACMDR